jgi:hypothetical protein
VGTYRSITEVPPAVIREQVLDLLRSYGATDRDELVRTVRERLGFKTTGAKIRKAIESAVEQLLRSGQLIAGEENSLRLSSVSRAAPS